MGIIENRRVTTDSLRVTKHPQCGVCKERKPSFSTDDNGQLRCWDCTPEGLRLGKIVED